MTRSLHCYREPRAVLGEGPVWDPVSARLQWLDADQKKLFRLDPMTEGIEAIDLPHSPGCYAYRAGGMIMAYRNQLVLANADAGDPQWVPTPTVDFAIERFNDGLPYPLTFACPWPRVRSVSLTPLPAMKLVRRAP